MKSLIDINNIAFTILDYPLSYLEMIATLSGIISVIFATKVNIWTWIIGMINVFFLSILFYEIHLYADMILQFYYVVVNIIGIITWSRPQKVFPISKMNTKSKIVYSIIFITLGTLIAWFMSHIHLLIPRYFPNPAAYPVIDSYILVGSILSTLLLAKKKIENWIIWIILDIASSIIFIQKGVNFIAIQYIIFTCIAIYGYINWSRKMKQAPII